MRKGQRFFVTHYLDDVRIQQVGIWLVVRVYRRGRCLVEYAWSEDGTHYQKDPKPSQEG